MSAPIDDVSGTRPTQRPGFWRRPVVLAIAALAIVALVVVLVVFQPQRLLYNVAIDDEFPAVEDVDASSDPEPAPEQQDPDGRAAGSVEDPDSEGTTPEADLEDDGDDGDDGDEGDDGAEDDPAAEEPAAEPPTEPVALATGTFESRNRYTTTGTATAFELPDGTRTLRLEDFETTNGPDLYVYLTVSDAADSDSELDTDFVDLGDLRGNVGNQNYPIPDDVDLDRYDTVVIWCLRFTSSFGVADLAG